MLTVISLTILGVLAYLSLISNIPVVLVYPYQQMGTLSGTCDIKKQSQGRQLYDT